MYVCINYKLGGNCHRGGQTYDTLFSLVGENQDEVEIWRTFS